MKTKTIGETIKWHIEGTLDEQGEGTVIEILEWPIVCGARAYVVSRDHPTIKVSIIPIDWVMEKSNA